MLSTNLKKSNSRKAFNSRQRDKRNIHTSSINDIFDQSSIRTHDDKLRRNNNTNGNQQQVIQLSSFPSRTKIQATSASDFSPVMAKNSNVKETAFRDALDALKAKNQALDEKNRLLNETICS